MGAAPVCTEDWQTCPTGARQKKIVGCCCAFAAVAAADSERPITADRPIAFMAHVIGVASPHLGPLPQPPGSQPGGRGGRSLLRRLRHRGQRRRASLELQPRQAA